MRSGGGGGGGPRGRFPIATSRMILAFTRDFHVPRTSCIGSPDLGSAFLAGSVVLRIPGTYIDPAYARDSLIYHSQGSQQDVDEHDGAVSFLPHPWRSRIHGDCLSAHSRIPNPRATVVVIMMMARGRT